MTLTPFLAVFLSLLYKILHSASPPHHRIPPLPPSSSNRLRNWKSLPSTSSRSLEEMMKVVVKLEVNDQKSKKKAMQIVSSISGVNSVSMDMKDKKLTVTGDVDAVGIVRKLRKICYTDIVSVGPEKEPEKKKDEPKKPDEKTEKDQVAELVKAYQAYNPHLTQYYFVRSLEEDPNACVIC